MYVAERVVAHLLIASFMRNNYSKLCSGFGNSIQRSPVGHTALLFRKFQFHLCCHVDVAATNNVDAAVTKNKPGTNSRWESNILCKMFESTRTVQEPYHLKMCVRTDFWEQYMYLDFSKEAACVEQKLLG